MRRSFVIAVVIALVATRDVAADKLAAGHEVFKKLCAECHGANGEGVPEAHEKPLRGRRSLPQLVRFIDENMPDEEPELCTGDAAENVAAYIYESFYAADPPRIELARLTRRQYLYATTDLVSSFTGLGQVGDRRGLNAEYYENRIFGGDKRVDRRIDPRIDFDFGNGSPHEKIKQAEEFSIRWKGSLRVEDTGDYEFILKTENGAKLWVNNPETPLIDAWVSSQGRDSERRVTIRLVGGRPYPIRLDMFKYKDKTASVLLQWKPPHKPRHVIPKRNLAPDGVPATFVVSAAFPADDRVTGYERGTSISQLWHQATTDAAVQIATHVAERLAGNENERARQFCTDFSTRAFRRPLTDEQRRLFIDIHFERTANTASAVKRSVLMTLQSPRFLYPALGTDGWDDYDAASQLSFGLWDSLPDKPLLDAAAAGKLRSPDEIEQQAKRMLTDPRAMAKLLDSFHHWLALDEKQALAKDKFADFDAALIADLRTSLDLFLEDVVREDASDYRRLLLADYLFLNERLARFFGVQPPASDGFEKVVLPPNQRAGVITHPYLMSTLAYSDLSSPIHRGVFVSRQLLGRTLRPPREAIEFKDSDFEKNMTMREKVTLLTDAKVCQNCHRVINPLGFSLEHYDAAGRYREQEHEGKSIDASAVYNSVTGASIELNGARSLAEFVAGSRQAAGAFVDQIFHQAVKQPIHAHGDTVRRDLINKFVEADYNIKALLVEIMKVSVLYRSKTQGKGHHVVKE